MTRVVIKAVRDSSQSEYEYNTAGQYEDEDFEGSSSGCDIIQIRQLDPTR